MPLRFDIIALFPEMVQPALSASMLGKAQNSGLIGLRVVPLRDYAEGRHRITDEPPFGGGGGMILKPEPVFAAVEANRCPPDAGCRESIILLSPQGEVFTQEKARELSQMNHIILICGHYEGVDDRVREHLATEELSVGDYILTAGEVAALVVVDAVSRLVPGVLGDENAPENDSFSQGLLEYPHYTRPADFRGWRVPEVLLSGHHEQIRRWRREQALRRTLLRRPDLLAKAELSEQDRSLLAQMKNQLCHDGSEDRQRED
jgi:tRNA (guanine37-N1)-methyltransferase